MYQVGRLYPKGIDDIDFNGIHIKTSFVVQCMKSKGNTQHYCVSATRIVSGLVGEMPLYKG
jgi:hypothetical protein